MARTSIPLATIGGLWSRTLAEASSVSQPTKQTPADLAARFGLALDDPALLLLVAVLCGNAIIAQLRPAKHEMAWIQCEGEVILAIGLVRYPLLSVVVQCLEHDDRAPLFDDQPILGLAGLCRNLRRPLESLGFASGR